MTVSMLQGESGNQRKELEKLVHWLLTEIKPDIVHLSNSLQLGMARMLRQQCGPPVVCQLSGEDLFLEKLPQPYHDEARAILRERAADADAFVSINRYYADFMADYLAVDRARIHVIPHGLKLDGHGKRLEKRPDEPRVVGYLARVCAQTKACICWSRRASSWQSATICRHLFSMRPAISAGATANTSNSSKPARPVARWLADSNTTANSIAHKRLRSCNRSM